MIDILIAHRGEPETWPENSLIGYREVLRAGARYIETDVQITADGMAILSHDPSLLKVTDTNRVISDTPSADILSLPAGHPDRFGDRFRDLRIATLAEFAELLAAWPDARAFVEIKHASVNAFGVERVVDLILETLAGVLAQPWVDIVLSGAANAAQLESNLQAFRVEWDETAQETAHRIAETPEVYWATRSQLPWN